MILLHADDYGYDETVDERMLRLVRAKKLAGLSVLSTMATKASLKKLAKATHGQKTPRIALHVNLTDGRSRSLTGSATVRDQNGRWANTPKRADRVRRPALAMNVVHWNLLSFILQLFTRRISQKSIEEEIERQMSILTDVGINVTAIDSHQHVHALSPVAEAIVAVARKHRIRYLRSYQDTRRYTVISQIKYRILQVASCISHIVYHRRFGLPITWKIAGDPIAVMSWESPHFNTTNDQRRTTSDPITYITHPYLPFDSNTHYMRFFQY